MADERKAIHAYVALDVHDKWHEVSEEMGVSLSGLLGAIAQDWIEDPPAEEDGWMQRIAGRARKIDAKRRRRGGK